MGVDVKSASGGFGGVLASKAGKTAIGFLTGGFGGAGLALAGANNPSIGQASALYGAINGASKGGELTDQDKSQIDSGSEDAMGRRMAQFGDSLSPKQYMSLGVQALQHPDVPDDIKAVAAPSILGAYHFEGPHPEIDKAMAHLYGTGEA